MITEFLNRLLIAVIIATVGYFYQFSVSVNNALKLLEATELKLKNAELEIAVLKAQVSNHFTQIQNFQEKNLGIVEKSYLVDNSLAIGIAIFFSIVAVGLFLAISDQNNISSNILLKQIPSMLEKNISHVDTTINNQITISTQQLGCQISDVGKLLELTNESIQILEKKFELIQMLKPAIEIEKTLEIGKHIPLEKIATNGVNIAKLIFKD